MNITSTRVNGKIDYKNGGLTRGQEFNRNAMNIWAWTMHEPNSYRIYDDFIKRLNK